jgi:magnesium-transporting ATPase (P-type)
MNESMGKQSGEKWYSMEAGKVLEKLGTNIDKGLSESDVRERMETHGRNDIPRGKKRSGFVRFIIQFHNVLIYVLIAAAVITALMDHWIDTWVILAVVVINALIGFLQEGKAERALESIRENVITGDSSYSRYKKANH